MKTTAMITGEIDGMDGTMTGGDGDRSRPKDKIIDLGKMPRETMEERLDIRIVDRLHQYDGSTGRPKRPLRAGTGDRVPIMATRLADEIDEMNGTGDQVQFMMMLSIALHGVVTGLLIREYRLVRTRNT
jgi:hypothetical protein